MTEAEKPYAKLVIPARSKRKFNDQIMFEPAHNLCGPLIRTKDEISQENVSKASYFDLGMAKSSVNEYIHFEKSFKGRIPPFRSVLHFTSSSLIPFSSYDSVLTKEQQKRIESVYYQFAP